MKSGWVKKKLGDVCEINYGTRVRRKDSRSDNYPVYGGGGETFRWETFNRENQCVVSRFAMSPECVRFVSGKFFLNDSGLTVDTASDGLLQDYLDWCLFGKQDIIYALGKGSAQKNLDIREFGNIPIPIPPLSEQKRIVAKIDAAFEKIDKLKANAERNLANAKELFQSALDEAMRPKDGWVEKRLGEVYNFIDYRGKTPNKINEGVPLITARNIRMGYLDYTVRDFISQAEYKTRQSRGIARKGDILFTTEAPLGFVALADLDEFSTGQRVITFQQYKGSELHLLNEFYFYYFQANGFQGEIRKRATGATAQGIKASRLREIPVAVVPYAGQQSVVKRLDVLAAKTDLLEQHYARQIADCAEMRQSVLREAFEGRL